MGKSKDKTIWESYYFNRVVLQVLDVAPLRDTRHLPSNQGSHGVKPGGVSGDPMEVSGETLTFTVVLN